MSFPNLHPAFSALPSGAILIWVVLEVASFWLVSPDFRKAKRFVSYATLLFCVLSFGSGYLANYLLPNELIEKHIQAIGWHHAFGKLVLIGVIASTLLLWISERALYNKGLWAWVYRASLLLTALFVFVTSHKGGELVFEKGLGAIASLRPE